MPEKKTAWYRREPWLATVAASFVPLTAAAVLPDPLTYPLVGVSGLLIVVALVLLVRQGIFRDRPQDAT
jgi:hypothetical protein